MIIMHYHNMCLQIMLEVRRLGGGFGSKIDRNHLVSVPCALAAHVMNAPVKIALDLNTNMKMIGKRYINFCFNPHSTFHVYCLLDFYLCLYFSVNTMQFSTHLVQRLSKFCDAFNYSSVSCVASRLPYYVRYRAGVAEDGRINGIEIDYYCDCGYTDVCFAASMSLSIADNVYFCENWTLNAYAVRTNTAVNTFCR